MRSALTALLGIVLGLTLALALLSAVELFSAAVYPVPAELQNDIPEHVRRYPSWILGVAVLAWGGTAAATTWVAARVGGRVAGIVLALLLGWALVYNVTQLPYALWFKVVMLGLFPFACLLGIASGSRRR